MSCFCCENKSGGHFTRFKSEKLGEIIAKNMAKNNKKTSQRATSAIWRILAELNNSKSALPKMNLTSMNVFKLGIILNE